MTRSDRGPDADERAAPRSADQGSDDEGSADQDGLQLAAMLKWSALMLLASLVIAAISIPLLRLFGFD
jgi:hypothetical protein